MAQVDYFLWMLPPDNWRRKPGPSTYRMTAEEALKRYPGATPILDSREVRQIGDGAPISAAESKYSKR